MPFSKEVKARMFRRCWRLCCLCLKKCGTNIEAAHIIAEAAGGTNKEENGIPVCLDCHQEMSAYDDNHPKGNKFTPEELRERRDQVYQWVESGKIPSVGNDVYLEKVEIRGGEGGDGPGGDAGVKGRKGQGITMIGGSIIGGKGGDRGGKGGNASLEGGDGF